MKIFKNRSRIRRRVLSREDLLQLRAVWLSIGFSVQSKQWHAGISLGSAGPVHTFSTKLMDVATRPTASSATYAQREHSNGQGMRRGSCSRGRQERQGSRTKSLPRCQLECQYGQSKLRLPRS